MANTFEPCGKEMTRLALSRCAENVPSLLSDGRYLTCSRGCAIIIIMIILIIQDQRSSLARATDHDDTKLLLVLDGGKRRSGIDPPAGIGWHGTEEAEV